MRDAVPLPQSVHSLGSEKRYSHTHQLPKVPNLHLSRLISPGCLEQRLEQVPVLRPRRTSLSSSHLPPSSGLLPMLPYCLAALFNVSLLSNQASLLSKRYPRRCRCCDFVVRPVPVVCELFPPPLRERRAKSHNPHRCQSRHFFPPPAIRVLGTAFSLRSSLDESVKELRDLLHFLRY